MKKDFFFGTNRSTTHPYALAKIPTVRYLLSRVEQTKFKGLAYLNNVRLVIVNGANITLFDLFKRLMSANQLNFKNNVAVILFTAIFGMGTVSCRLLQQMARMDMD